jgi:hypothetical protein
MIGYDGSDGLPTRNPPFHAVPEPLDGSHALLRDVPHMRRDRSDRDRGDIRGIAEISEG